MSELKEVQIDLLNIMNTKGLSESVAFKVDKVICKLVDLEHELKTAPLAYAVFNSEGKIKDVGFDKKKLSGKWGLSYDFGKDWKVKPVRLVEEKL